MLLTRSLSPAAFSVIDLYSEFSDEAGMAMVNSKLARIFKRILESWNLAKNAKRFAKMRRRKYDDSALTTAALTTIRPYAKSMLL
jgi:hypothetical protein